MQIRMVIQVKSGSLDEQKHQLKLKLNQVLEWLSSIKIQENENHIHHKRKYPKKEYMKTAAGKCELHTSGKMPAKAAWKVWK